MRHLLYLAIIILGISALPANAQPATFGDAPRADRITVSATDDANTVTLTGDAGAVFNRAALAVRNLYTGATVYETGNPDGSFTATITGSPYAMYQVNVASSYPPGLRESYDVLPGIGTLIYQPRGDTRTFDTAGTLSYGGATWQATGTLNTLDVAAGDALSLAMDIIMRVPEANLALAYTMLGDLSLRRVADAEGNPLSSAQDAGYGWSSRLTSTGLPILGATTDDISLAQASKTDIRVDDENSTLAFTLTFDATLPVDHPAGLYVPVITGQSRIADSEPFDWYANRVFSTAGDDDTSRTSSATTLPIVLQVGTVERAYLPMSVFERPPEPPRLYGVANLIEHTPPLAVRPPGTYALAPTLPSLLRYGVDAPPLLPIVDSAINIVITQPDGTLDFAETGGVRLTNNRFTISADVYEFTAYGDYLVRYGGFVEDATGRRYDVSGGYPLTIAEPLTLHPAVLPGTPLRAGDVFYGGMTVSPAFPAEMSISLSQNSTLLLDDCSAECRATLTDAGEYTATYTARYTDDAGQLWAGSLRTAGVISDDVQTAFGARGLLAASDTPQAWFDTRVYPPDIPPDARLPIVQFPLFSGDVAYLPADERGGIVPTIITDDYSYRSVYRPGVQLRDVISTNAPKQPLFVTNDDTLNAPIGIGVESQRPDDTLFLFGGAVDDASVRGYAGSAVITRDDFARVVPPFTAPLLDDNDTSLDALLYPTGTPPGSVINGEMSLHTYIMPARTLRLTPQMIALTGESLNTLPLGTDAFGRTADAPTVALPPGVWRVNWRADAVDTVTSAGTVSRPLSAAVVGVPAEEGYFVFSVPADTPPLDTPRDPVSIVAPDAPFTINVRAPETWQETVAYVSVRIPGVVLDQQELSTFANQTNYTFNRAQLARLHTNFESTARAASDADEVTITLVITGTDANGTAQIRARVFTLRGNTLITP